MLEILYVALPSNFYQVRSYEGPRAEDAPRQGFPCSNHRITINRFKKSSSLEQLAQMFEIWHVAMPSGLLSSMFKSRPQVPRWPLCQGVPGLNHRNRKIKKIFFFRTNWLRCLIFNMWHTLVDLK